MSALFQGGCRARRPPEGRMKKQFHSVLAHFLLAGITFAVEYFTCARSNMLGYFLEKNKIKKEAEIKEEFCLLKIFGIEGVLFVNVFLDWKSRCRLIIHDV